MTQTKDKQGELIVRLNETEMKVFFLMIFLSIKDHS